MVRKLAPNSLHLTRRLVKSVPGRGHFRAVPSKNRDKYVTSPPSPIVEPVETSYLWSLAIVYKVINGCLEVYAAPCWFLLAGSAIGRE